MENKNNNIKNIFNIKKNYLINIILKKFTR